MKACRIIVPFRTHTYRVDPKHALTLLPETDWKILWEDEDGWVGLEFTDPELAGAFLDLLEGKTK